MFLNRQRDFFLKKKRKIEAYEDFLGGKRGLLV